MHRLQRLVLSVIALLLGTPPAAASDVEVAVAANFAHPMQRIAQAFAQDTGHHAILVTGATGTFFAQIENGAPFDVVLAADRTTPERLERDGFALSGSRFTYAMGVLVLWSAQPGYVDAEGAVLRRGAFAHLAIANPRLAPYGAAALEALTAMGLIEAVRPKLVQGESVAQAQQFVASGNAELGFVALSQVVGPDGPPTGSHWVVPAHLYGPIQQQAALLRRGANNPGARALCEYLHGTKARSIVRSYGYELPDAAAP